MLAVQPDSGTLEPALRAAQRGDVAAFNTLVLTYQRQLFNVCYRTLGNSEDAADATQDALLSAFRGLKTFNGPASGLRGWLLRIAVNACYDQLRRARRRPEQSLGDIGEREGYEVISRLRAARSDVENALVSRDLAVKLLARLSPEDRMVLTLLDVEGFSVAEIAKLTNWSVSKVKVRAHRARAHLRRVLKRFL